MSFRTDRVRVAMFVKRKATISKEQFHQYWAETHAPLVSSLNIVKTNLLKYEQVCKLRNLSQPAMVENNRHTRTKL
jgi:hypothetical protein